MRLRLAIAASLCACGGTTSRTAYYAVGATDYWASPVTCRVEGDSAGALVPLPDHYKTKDGKGLVFQAVKPGKARIECADGENGSKIEVREAVRVELRRTVGTQQFPIGVYAPTFCLRAFDKDGTELELGSLIDGVDVQWSEHVSRSNHHAIVAGDPACTVEGMATKEGKGTVTATWRGFTATADFEVKGARPE